MKAHNLLLGLLMAGILAIGLFMTGCEGKEGPAGPQGPEGPVGPGPGDEQVYLGNDAESCGHCHSSFAETWIGTNHFGAYSALPASQQSNPACQQCHTTGYNTSVDNRGYDDDPRPAVEGVQCEACHGPMGPALNHAPIVFEGRTGEACSACHSRQWNDYITSGHGTVLQTSWNPEGDPQEDFISEWGGSSCRQCHISEGFLINYAPNWAGRSLPEDAWQVTCVTCHDPHAKDNESQLREAALADVTSPYGGPDYPTGYTITGWGQGQLCAQCHHARRNESNIMGQINNGSAHPGPHESPQSDMISGLGCYQIPSMTYEGVGELNHSLSITPDVCVTCHFVDQVQDNHTYATHTFRPQLSKCQTCHSGATNFDIGGVQTETLALLEELGALLPQQDGTVMAAMDTINWTREQREAGYAYYFVEADGSHGVHNPTYARSILQNAIDHLSAALAEGKKPGVRG